VADLWEGYIHEQGFIRPHLSHRHDLHLKQMGGGLDNLSTNKMLTPNISLRSCLAKQLRDVCDAGVTHHLLLLLTAICKRVICESTGEANNGVWSWRSKDPYSSYINPACRMSSDLDKEHSN
jgi:hypothetical protein